MRWVGGSAIGTIVAVPRSGVTRPRSRGRRARRTVFFRPMHSVTRAELVATLHRALAQGDAVDAAWEGGSAAFASDDELSDVDAVAVVADDAVAATFARVEAALDRLSPVTLRHDVAGTIGFAQKFYRCATPASSWWSIWC